MKCYTIGHSTRSLEEFLNLIKSYGIDCIIDIRTRDYNESDVYSMENIERYIKQCGVNYIYMGKELGCKNAESQSGKRDKFLDVIEDKLLEKGLYRIIDGIKRGHKIGIMCIEKNPLNCKRAIVLGYVLKKMGVELQHIISDIKWKTQDRIEEEIFITYEPMLNKKIIKLTTQDVVELEDCNDIKSEDIKNIKARVIEEGYKIKFKELTE